MLNKTWLKWRKEIMDTINSIEVETEPFCHFFVEPFLPDEMYEKMEQYWPDDECFWGQCEISEKPLAHEFANLKKVVLVDDAAGFSKNKEASEFWANFRELLRGVDLTNAIVKKTVDHIVAVRNDLDFADIQCWSNALLIVDMNDFQLGPHIDSQKSLISLLFYLPQPNNSEDIGTSIFVPSRKILEKYPKLGKEFGTGYQKDEDFEEVYRAPYRRNCLFGIVTDPRAFHGVKRLEGMENGRRNMLWSVTTDEANPYPSALERVKKGISLEMVQENRKKEQVQDRLAKLMAAKQELQ
jgi:hypothetical protein